MQDKEPEPVMLYTIPNNSRIRIDINEREYFLNFSHIDGMYSYCKDDEGNVHHIKATSLVHVVQSHE